MPYAMNRRAMRVLFPTLDQLPREVNPPPVNRLRRGKEWQHFSELESSKEREHLDWLVGVIKDPHAISWTEEMNLRPQIVL